MTFVFDGDQDNATSALLRRTQKRAPVGFAEGFGTGRQAALQERSISRSVNLAEGYDPIIERLNEGVADPAGRVLNPYGANITMTRRTRPGTSEPISQENLEDHVWRTIQSRREAGEDLSDLPKTREELHEQVLAQARERIEAAGEASQFATAGGQVGLVAGGFAGALEDPAVAATLAVGAPASAGILRTAIVESLIGGATEAAIQPAVAAYRDQMGLEYTRDDFLRNVGFAAGGGFLLGGALKAAGRGVEALVGRMGSDRGTAEAFDEAVANPTAEQRGAREELQAEIDVEKNQPDVDTGPQARADHRRRWRATEDAARDGQAPEMDTVAIDRRRAEVTPEGGALERVNPDDVRIDAERFQFKAGAGEKGVTERLQGVTRWDDSKAGIAMIWEAEDGTRYIADGHQRVALARRLREQGQDVRLNAMVFREADGFTSDFVRVHAAAKNIAEGTGSPIDAAKVLRETGTEVADETLATLPPQSALVRQGRGLANLGDEAFGAVVNELIPAHYGAIIGRLVDDPDLQRAVAEVIMREAPDNAVQAESMVRQALAVGTSERTAAQGGLFADEGPSLLFRERAQVLDRGLKKLRRDKRAFRTLVDEAGTISAAGNRLDTTANQQRAATDAEAIDTIQRLAHVRGPVSDALNDAARRAESEGRFDRAVDDFLESIRDAAERGDLARSAAGAAGRPDESPGPSATVRAEPARAAEADQERLSTFDEPGGEGAQDQAQALDDAMRPREQRGGASQPARDPAIEDISQASEALGVDVFATRRGNTVTIAKITVPEAQREQGLGSQAMEAINAIADSRGLQLALSPTTDFGASIQRLRRFYKRHGFVNNTGKNRDFEVSESMIRRPGDLTDDQKQLLETMQAARAEREVAEGEEPARDVTETAEDALTAADVDVDDPEQLASLLSTDRELFDAANARRAARGLDPFEDVDDVLVQLDADLSDMVARPLTVDTLDEATLRQRREQAIAHLADRGGLAEGTPGANINTGRRADIVLGPPAAGKSSALVNPLAAHHGSMVIDADEAKKAPALEAEYDGGRGANAVHEESAQIVAQLWRRQITEGRNIVYPKVGKTREGVEEIIEELNTEGYQVYLHVVELPPAKTMQRMLLRYVSTGRLLPPDYVKSIGRRPRETYDAVKGKAQGYSALDNDVAPGETPRVLEAGGAEVLWPDVYPRSRAGRGLGDPARDAGRPEELTEAEQAEAADLADMEIPVAERVDDEGNVIAETRTVREAFDEADADDRFADEVEACAG